MINRDSQLKQAKTFLAEEFPSAYAPAQIIDLLNLNLTEGTLSRKFRAAAKGATPELLKTYYRNHRGEEIAQYAYNPDFILQAAAERRQEEAEMRLEAARENMAIEGLK